MKKITYIVGLVAIVLVAGTLSLANFGSKNIVSENEEKVATVAIQSVETITDSASLALVNGKLISWETSGFGANLGVNINLIKKVSDSPTSYTLIRKIAENTANDGNETWIPGKGETGNDLYVEVTCANTVSEACNVSGNPILVN